jgi:hypothetical protein
MCRLYLENEMKTIQKTNDTEYQVGENVVIELLGCWIVTVFDDFGDIENELEFESFKSALDAALELGV